MRHRLPWLLALPLMVAGSLAAHAVSYGFVRPPSEGTGEGSERSSAGLGGHTVMALGILTAFVVVAAVGFACTRSRGGVRRGVPAWLFFLLPLVAFSAQELVERLVRAEAAPFHAALEPRFLIGLLLQVPFGVLALLVARPLLRVVRRIVRALGRRGRLVAWDRLPVELSLFACELPRIPALALGYPERGPPPRI